MNLRRIISVIAFALAVGSLGFGCSGGSSSDAATSSSTTTDVVVSSKPASTPLLDKQATTVLDQLLTYPSSGQAQVSSAVLTFAPGATTGMHLHDAPLYVYVIEGTITVTYDGDVVKEYSAGQAILETVGTAHNGANLTDAPVKLLVVNMGAEGVTNTVSL